MGLFVGRRAAIALLAAAFLSCTTSSQSESGRHSAPSITSTGLSPEGHHRAFRATTNRSFEDVEHWTRVFDDPARDEWQLPDRVVAALAIQPGSLVVDLGAGTGYFAGRLAVAVGASGTVLAVETEPSLVVYLRQRAEREGTANVVPVLASYDNPRIPPNSADLILIVDTFHHIDNRLGYFQRLSGSLRPQGRVAIIDWRKKDLPVGPKSEHKISKLQVIKEMRAAGFRLEAELTFLPYQYFLVFYSATTTKNG